MCDNKHTHGALFSGGHMVYCNFSLQLWQVAVLVIFREPKFCSLVVICLVKFNKQLILYVKNYAPFSTVHNSDNFGDLLPPWVVSCGEPFFIFVSRHKCSIVYVRVCVCVVHCERLLVIHVLGSTNCSQLYNVN